jgi:DNA-binding response OmpR family regulator
LRVRGHGPPVIVVTAHDAPELRDEAMRRGASGYLAKPFRGKDLLAAIEVAVRSGQAP